MLKFFYSTQTCSTAVHIALEEAEIPFDGVEVSWKRKVNVAELETVNPLGQVPVLVDGKKTLIQSMAILEYIAEKAPEKNLLPRSGTWERSEATAWLAFIGADFQKSFAPIFRASRWTNDKSVQETIIAATREGIDKHLAYLDNSLAGKEYLLGNRFSVADAYLFTILGWCKWAEVKVGKYSNVTAYMKRILKRPAVQKVLEKEEMQDYLPA
jgi:glutathione S-transferase